MVEHMEAELWQGPQLSADSEDAIKQLNDETKEKVAKIYEKVIKYGEVKKNLPT